MDEDDVLFAIVLLATLWLAYKSIKGDDVCLGGLKLRRLLSVGEITCWFHGGLRK